MKEFNLEEAMAGKPVCTRDGIPARILCWDRSGIHPIVALVKIPQQLDEEIYTYSLKGEYVVGKIHYLDLMMASEKKEGG